MSRRSKTVAALIASVLCLTAFTATAFATDEIPGGEEIDPVPAVTDAPAPDYEEPVYTEPVYVEPVVTDPPYDDNTESGGEAQPDYGYEDNSGGYDDDYSYEEPYENDIVYYDSDGNSYSDQSDVYVGGGQVYEPPISTAPSAALYESDSKIDVKTLSDNDWSDIAKNLQNASLGDDDGSGDFSFIQKASGTGDDGNWIIITGMACFLLGLASLIYFIVSTVKVRRSVAAAPQGGSSGSRTVSSKSGGRYSDRSSDDYDDGYKSAPRKSSSKGGRRYR